MSQLFWSESTLAHQWQRRSVDWPEIGFRQFWILSIALLVLNIGRLTGIINTNPLEKGVFLVALAFFCIKNPVNKPALVFLGVLTLPIYVFGAFTEYSDFSWLRLNMAYVALLSIVGFYVVTPTRRDMELVLKSIAILPLVMLIYGCLLFLLGKPLTMRDHTGAMRLAGGTMPAFLAAASYAASVAAAYLFCSSKRSIFFFLCVGSLVVCALSGTRTPTVVAAASVGTIFFLRFTGVQRIALVVLGSVGLAAFLLTIGDQLMMRFMSSSSSGREAIWNIVETWVARYPNTGIGFGHCGAVIPWYISRMTGTEATHNEYLRLALELGYWGTVCFFVAFVALCMAAIKKFSFEALILLGFFFVYAYTDNVFFLTYALLGPLACIHGIQLTQETAVETGEPAAWTGSGAGHVGNSEPYRP